MHALRLTPSVSVCNLHRQRGASLLEGIAYLGIAAIIILGAVALLTSAFSGANTNRGYEEVTAIRTGVKRLYMGQSASYGTGDLTATLISAKVFPTSLSVSGASVKNTWNGDVSVTGASANFTISYGNVPSDVCINMVSGSSDWVSVKVGSGAAAAPPIAPATASSACGTGSSTIVWTGN
ncbi:type 4 pilus major pilin [Noviherbaspirillum saxi]|uniref:Pilus assembly protein n=1 Tax=Noviherbaspirillum saxi TaxID=2320863 RepID=A0A3A3FFJ7_9BURK|nr:type 4 pilus major pilin [Noviherbaspirillum saxi]RJF92126.1 pilus assembly protein [Noviherbaspirillum saxi]